MSLVLTSGCTQNNTSVGTQEPQSGIPSTSISTPTPIQIKTYSNYGLSFNYPEGTPIIESRKLDNKDPTYNSGQLLIGDLAERGIDWQKSNGKPKNLDELYLNHFKEIQSNSNSNYTDVEIGNIETISHLGQTVSTVHVKSYYNEKYYKPNVLYNTQFAWWYCPESDRVFFLTEITHTKDKSFSKNKLMAFLDSFKCH